MKEFIRYLLLFVLVISLAACSPGKSTEDLPENKPDISENSVLTINIYRPPTPNINIYEHLDEWEQTMMDVYGIDIKIHNISPMYQYEITNASYYPERIRKGDIKGIIEIKQWEIQNLVELKNEGLILPLDDFLAENQVYQKLPGAMKRAFVMPDGKTWALATSSPFGLYSRKLRKKWVDNLGLQLPGTLDELYELTRAFVYEDPNGNGLNDEHGMDIDLRRGARSFVDIFLANSCYLSNNTNSSIAFDYETGAYEDAMLKPGMKKALEYIKALNDNGLMVKNNSWDFLQNENSGNFMSLSINTDYRLIDINDWYEIYTISENDISIMGLRPYKLFVMTVNTENPKGTINTFVNTFLSDIRGLANGNYGIEGKSYTLEDNVLTCKFGEDGSDLSRYIADNVSLTHFNYNIIIEEGITLIDPQWTDISIPNAIRETKLYNDFYNEGQLFFDSDFMLYGDVKNINDRFNDGFREFIQNIDNAGVGDFIDNYINNAKVSGWQEILDEINTEAGKIASYRYN